MSNYYWNPEGEKDKFLKGYDWLPELSFNVDKNTVYVNKDLGDELKEFEILEKFLDTLQKTVK